MAPKTKFSKEQIIDAAFEIARIDGIDSITIRKVAEKMGSSIAPIYVNFENVNQLIQEVVKKTFDISKQMLLDQNTGNPFHDIGVARLRFAKEYSVLFRDLVMKQNDYMKDYDQEMGNDLVQQMKNDSDLQGFSEEELMTILFKMRVFQTGLTVMVANGLLPEEFDEEKMIMTLESTASDVIAAARLRQKKH
jgi:AcrR family transcriptional regulator